MIQDSGNRREFSSGAVRDVAEGKGRMDFIPWDVAPFTTQFVNILYDYLQQSDLSMLNVAMLSFCRECEWDMPTMYLEVAIHYEAGISKYGNAPDGRPNWQLGIPIHSYIDSALRHYFKWRRGDDDEPHDRAVIWNLLCAAWTHKHLPELIDVGGGREGNGNGQSNQLPYLSCQENEYQLSQ